MTRGKAIALLGTSLLAGACLEEPERSKKLKVVAMFATEVSEPWDGAIHQALTKLKLEGAIDYQMTDKVTPSDFERVLREYARGDADLIMGDAFSSEAIVRDLARQFPKKAFVFGSGLGPVDPNLSVFDDWIHESAFLAGMVAGRLTKTGTVGAVAGMDIPEVNRLLNAFKAGALDTNKRVKFKVAYLGSFFDPIRTAQLARTMLASGVDVMYGERDGVIEPCADRKKFVIGNMVDQSNIAPAYVVTSVLWNMLPTVRRIVEQVKTHTYGAEDYRQWSMLAKDGTALAPLNHVDEDTRRLIGIRQQEIKEGAFRVVINENVVRSD